MKKILPAKHAWSACEGLISTAGIRRLVTCWGFTFLPLSEAVSAPHHRIFLSTDFLYGRFEYTTNHAPLEWQ